MGARAHDDHPLGALSGAGEVRLPTLCYVVAFWGITIPLAYLFGLNGNPGAVALLGWRIVDSARGSNLS